MFIESLQSANSGDGRSMNEPVFVFQASTLSTEKNAGLQYEGISSMLSSEWILLLGYSGSILRWPLNYEDLFF